MGRWKLATVVLVGFMAGLACASGDDGVIQTQRLELIDTEGRIRAIMAVGLDGVTAMQFLGVEGKLRMSVGLASDGTAGLVIYEEIEVRGEPETMPIVILGEGVNGLELRLFSVDPKNGLSQTILSAGNGGGGLIISGTRTGANLHGYVTEDGVTGISFKAADGTTKQFP